MKKIIFILLASVLTACGQWSIVEFPGDELKELPPYKEHVFNYTVHEDDLDFSFSYREEKNIIYLHSGTSKVFDVQLIEGTDKYGVQRHDPIHTCPVTIGIYEGEKLIERLNEDMQSIPFQYQTLMSSELIGTQVIYALEHGRTVRFIAPLYRSKQLDFTVKPRKKYKD